MTPSGEEDVATPSGEEDVATPSAEDSAMSAVGRGGRQDAPARIVLAKLGLDGHDRGIKVVARMLRDAGMEVIYLGLRQTTDSIVAAVEQEDADAIGLSMHNAGHLTLGPAMLAALDEAGLEVPVIIGGIVPEPDLPVLRDAGIAAVLGPGSSAEEVVATVRRVVADT